MPKRTITIIHSLDGCGRELVKVPLSKTDQFATLYRADFEELLSLGLSPCWALHLGSVRTVLPKVRQYCSVARILTDARPGQVVRFLDDDKTNLRSENLFLDVGYSKHHDRSYMEPYHRMLKWRPSLQHIFEERTKTISEPGSVMPCSV